MNTESRKMTVGLQGRIPQMLVLILVCALLGAEGARLKKSSRYSGSSGPSQAFGAQASAPGIFIRGSWYIAYIEAHSGRNVDAVMLESARRGQVDALKGALEQGGDVDARSLEKGFTPLILAAAGNFTDVIDVLIANGATVDAVTHEGSTAILNGARKGNKEAIGIIVDAGGDFDLPNKKGLTPVISAIRANHSSTVKALVDMGANLTTAMPAEIGPVISAVLARNLEMVELMLGEGLDPNTEETKKGESTVWLAASSGADPILKVLIEADGDVHRLANDGSSPLFAAVQGNCTVCVKLLLKERVDIDVQRKTDGWTALHMAYAIDEKKLIKLLLNGGADPKIKDNDGRRPKEVQGLIGKQEAAKEAKAEEQDSEILPLPFGSDLVVPSIPPPKDSSTSPGDVVIQISLVTLLILMATGCLTCIFNRLEDPVSSAQHPPFTAQKSATSQGPQSTQSTLFSEDKMAHDANKTMNMSMGMGMNMNMNMNMNVDYGNGRYPLHPGIQPLHPEQHNDADLGVV